MNQVIQENLVVSTREFIRNFATLNRKPKSKRYRIVSHGQLVGTFIPYQPDPNKDWWDSLSSGSYSEVQEKVEQTKQPLTLKELRKKYSFHSGEPNLSERIDEIVYGVKR